jgi:hypothetical protein
MPFCPYCNQKTFEIEEVDVGDSKYKFVQCAGCKAPIGFIQQAHVDRSFVDFEAKITQALRVVVSSLQTIDSRLTRIEQVTQRRQ